MSKAAADHSCGPGELIVQVTRIGEARESWVEEMPAVADVVHFVMLKGDAEVLKEKLALGSVAWMNELDVAPSRPGCMLVLTHSSKYHFFEGQVFDAAIGPIRMEDAAVALAGDVPEQ